MMIRARDERGAVLMIVAICLLVLLGMLVLTFDLGRGVAIKRNMVAGADAGALAAARECALANGEAAAKQAATDLLADNNGAATVTGFQIDPGPAQCSGVPNPDPDGKNEVTVTASVPQEYFFAQIFGFNNGTVVATATATWTTGVAYPAPLKLEAVKVDDCLDPTSPFYGDPDNDGVFDCYFTYEKGPSPLNSDWGWLNLPEGWPDAPTAQDPNPPNPMTCTKQAGGSNDLVDYIGVMGGMGDPEKPFGAGLWDPTGGGEPPTYVCGATGHKSVSVEAMNEWVTNVKQLMVQGELKSEPVVQFPIVACDGSTPPCHEWKYTPGVAYPIVKLQGFWVKEAWDGQRARREPHCAEHFTRPSADVFCLHLQTTASILQTSGGDLTIRLVD